jgi:hypothetical protein
MKYDLIVPFDCGCRVEFNGDSPGLSTSKLNACKKHSDRTAIVDRNSIVNIARLERDKKLAELQ